MSVATASHRARLLILSILLVASTQAAAQAGQLDLTFGHNGIVTTDLGSQEVSPRCRGHDSARRENRRLRRSRQQQWYILSGRSLQHGWQPFRQALGG